MTTVDGTTKPKVVSPNRRIAPVAAGAAEVVRIGDVERTLPEMASPRASDPPREERFADYPATSWSHCRQKEREVKNERVEPDIRPKSVIFRVPSLVIRHFWFFVLSSWFLVSLFWFLVSMNLEL